MQLLQVTATGEQHGLINTLTNSVLDNDFKHMKPEVKARLEKEKKEDAKIGRYEYVNKKGKHERLDKVYCRYAGEPIQMYHLIPGKVYSLPKGLVKEINEQRIAKRSGLLSIDGQNVNSDGTPLAVDDENDWVHKLVRVE